MQSMRTPGITVATESREKPRQEDPVVRLEKMLESAMIAIAQLQSRVESLEKSLGAK